jgi:pyrroloquinoline quinone biosynthesis protein D
MNANRVVLSAESKPRVGPGFRLQWEPAQECHVLLYPEGMVRLNGSAGEIMKRCDGERSAS